MKQAISIKVGTTFEFEYSTPAIVTAIEIEVPIGNPVRCFWSDANSNSTIVHYKPLHQDAGSISLGALVHAISRGTIKNIQNEEK